MLFLSNLLLFVNQFAFDFLHTYILYFQIFNEQQHSQSKNSSEILVCFDNISSFTMGSFTCNSIVNNLQKRNIFPLIDLIVLFGLNWKQMEYAQLIFDTVIGPAYSNNKQTLQKISTDIEKLFNNKTQKLKQKVSDSTTQKLKGFIGQILVGTLNPNVKRNDSSREDSSQAQEDLSDKDQ